MPSKSDKKKVVFSVTNCICHDQRVLKIAQVVKDLGCDITIIGRVSGDCCKSDNVPFKTKRFRMLFKKGFLFYLFYNIRLFLYLLFHNFDLLISNDLDTLLPNYIISKLFRLPLVYDSHEYFTGVPELQNRPFVKWVWKTIERSIIPRLKNVMTVSDSIASRYKSEYGIRPLTVRNCSPKSESLLPYSKAELGINPGHLLLILQGTGINVDRGGEELIEAINKTENVSLLIVGSGNIIDKLITSVTANGLSERVKFINKVPWTELIRYTKSADAGISLDKDTNINHRYSLPNKLFDYISAGIPVIAGNLPEVGKLVSENNCGILIPSVTSEEICNAINSLRENSALLAELKRKAAIASKSINWEIESKKVFDFYNSLALNSNI
jgi:glycosyltransferase involved in cell wall biosynthesis